jgi:hypothetical protein
MRSDCDSTYDRGIRANSRAVADASAPILIFSEDRGSGVIYVGEDHAWPTKDIVFDSDRVIYGNVVLDLDPIPDRYFVADENILAK